MIAFLGNAQKGTFIISDSLNEVSGLELLNDSTLIALNDGGNGSLLFVTDLKGKIQRKIIVTNAPNLDWEDLAIDDKYLYIADIGNNRNQRKELYIYRVLIKDILAKNEVTAEKSTIRYKEQKEFPPKRKNKRFDGEALVVYRDSLLIFTKNRARPNDGNAWVYQIPKTPGDYTLKHKWELFVGKGGLMADAITGVDVYNDVFHIMTYNRIMLRKLENNEFTGDLQYNFKVLLQFEGIVVRGTGDVFVANERALFLGGARLHRITWKQ